MSRRRTRPSVLALQKGKADNFYSVGRRRVLSGVRCGVLSLMKPSPAERRVSQAKKVRTISEPLGQVDKVSGIFKAFTFCSFCSLALLLPNVA